MFYSDVPKQKSHVYFPQMFYNMYMLAEEEKLYGEEYSSLSCTYILGGNGSAKKNLSPVFIFQTRIEHSALTRWTFIHAGVIRFE